MIAKIIRWLSCKLLWCMCVPMDDDTGCWGECVTCGKRYGYVTREELRRYADRHIKQVTNEKA